jgi:hypothetical protein
MLPCLLDRLRRMGPGSVSAFTRFFDALWAGTTQMRKRLRGDERQRYKFFDAAAVLAASPHSGASAPSPQRLGR